MGNTRRIAILAYPQCLASELFAFRDVIAFADRIAEMAGATRLSTTLISVGGKAIDTSGGERIQACDPKGRRFDLYVVPGFYVRHALEIPHLMASCAEEIEFLRGLGKRGKPVASICIGAFLLAGAGLLDQRKATTAWFFADLLARKYPHVRVDKKALLVEDGPVITVGAFAATYDLALHVVTKFAGQEVSRTTRKLALIDSGRSSQAPYIDDGMLQTRKGSFAQEVEQWLTEHLTETYSLDTLATHFSTSPRHLLRKYKAEKRQTPLQYLHKIRVERAKVLLEQTPYSIERIAEKVGYQDMNAFRKLFHRHAGEPPGAYRRQFGKHS